MTSRYLYFLNIWNGSSFLIFNVLMAVIKSVISQNFVRIFCAANRKANDTKDIIRNNSRAYPLVHVKTSASKKNNFSLTISHKQMKQDSSFCASEHETINTTYLNETLHFHPAIKSNIVIVNNIKVIIFYLVFSFISTCNVVLHLFSAFVFTLFYIDFSKIYYGEHFFVYSLNFYNFGI